MMNEHPYFHWDLLRQPLQTPQFGMAPSFFDVNSILELRKEKSRDAARSRRGKENYEFYELAKMLPLPAAITSQLDKASIIRLTISYLKLRNFSCLGNDASPQWGQQASGAGGSGGGAGMGGPTNGKNGKGQRRMDLLDPFESRQGTHILQSLDGFAFILANDARFLYISETVSIYLGLSQVEMAGSSIFDYVHHEDHSQLADYLGMCPVTAPGPSNTPPSSGSDDAASPGQRSQSPSERGYAMVHQWDKSIHKSFSIRMKSTLTKRGAHVKTSGFRVLHILGTLRPQSIFGPAQGNSQSGSSTGGSSTNEENPPIGLVGIALALLPPTVSELRLEMDTFLLRLSPDFRVIHCDPPLGDLMDLTPEDVTDRLLYDLCHAADLKLLQQAHSDIISKGQVLTSYWRMMNRHGGFHWVQTCATTLFNNKAPEEQTILAINYVVSGSRDPGTCIDLWQVTGDVTSSMSSIYRCPARDQVLQGLQKTEGNKEDKLASENGQIKSQDKPTSTIGASGDGQTDKILYPNNSNTDPSPNKILHKDFQDIKSSCFGSSNKKEDETSSVNESKINRRKMDNPRKRKKSGDESESLRPPNKNKILNNLNTLSASASQCSGINGNSLQNETSTVTNMKYQKSTISPSPEDLTVKKTFSAASKVDNLRQTPTESRMENKNVSVVSSCFQATQKEYNTNKQTMSSSVHELEAAMNRHLPRQDTHGKTALSAEKEVPCMYEPATNHAITTISKGSAITPATAQSGQWIPQSPRTPPATDGDILPTSNLLRCLFTTRESVIKSNARPLNSTAYLSGETPSSLLTPPEPESTEARTGKDCYRGQNRRGTQYQGKESRGFDQTHLQYATTNSVQSYKGNDFGLREPVYKDNAINDQFQFLPYKDHISSAYMDHFTSNAGYKDHMVSPYKDFPQFKDIVPAFTIPNLVSPGGRFQQNYPSLSAHQFHLPVTSTPHQTANNNNSSSLTPPASNSPDTICHKTSQTRNLQHHPQQQPQLLPTNSQSTHDQGFDNSSNALSNSNDVTSSNHNNHTLSNKYFTPIQFHHPHHSSAPSPNTGYHHHHHHQYRPQDYTSPFHHSQDLSKAGYYGMASSPVASMYMDLTGSTTNQYEACHRPTLTWY